MTRTRRRAVAGSIAGALAAVLAGALAIGGFTDGAPTGPDLWLGGEASADEGRLGGIVSYRDLDQVHLSRAEIAPCIKGDGAESARVEITAITTEETQGDISITDFGIYDVPLSDGLPVMSEYAGPLERLKGLGPPRRVVDRLCSEEETLESRFRSDLIIEITRVEPRVDRLDKVEHATVHYTVDGEERTQRLPYALGMCTLPEGIEFGTPDDDGYCEGDA